MLQDIRKVLIFEHQRYVHNPAMIIAYALIGVLLASLCFYISQTAPDLATENSTTDGFLLGLISSATDPAIKHMIMDHPTSLHQIMLLVLTLWFTPILVMLLASDQTSTDIGSKHVRFLLPRLSRSSLFLGRLIGAWIAWAVLIIPTMILCALALSLLVEGAQLSADLMLVVRFAPLFALYGLPFVALMAFANSFTSNPFLSFLLGVGVWFLVVLLALMSGFSELMGQDSSMSYVDYLFPTVVKYDLLAADWGRFFKGLGVILAQAAVYGAAGYAIFTRRDL